MRQPRVVSLGPDALALRVPARMHVGKADAGRGHALRRRRGWPRIRELRPRGDTISLAFAVEVRSGRGAQPHGHVARPETRHDGGPEFVPDPSATSVVRSACVRAARFTGGSLTARLRAVVRAGLEAAWELDDGGLRVGIVALASADDVVIGARLGPGVMLAPEGVNAQASADRRPGRRGWSDNPSGKTHSSLGPNTGDAESAGAGIRRLESSMETLGWTRWVARPGDAFVVLTSAADASIPDDAMRALVSRAERGGDVASALASVLEPGLSGAAIAFPLEGAAGAPALGSTVQRGGSPRPAQSPEARTAKRMPAELWRAVARLVAGIQQLADELLPVPTASEDRRQEALAPVVAAVALVLPLAALALAATMWTERGDEIRPAGDASEPRAPWTIERSTTPGVGTPMAKRNAETSRGDER